VICTTENVFGKEGGAQLAVPCMPAWTVTVRGDHWIEETADYSDPQCGGWSIPHTFAN
jgi:hypothetical protein